MAYKLGDVSILVVEDNQPMQKLLRSILKTFGVGKIHIAKNGQEGFRMFCRENPDIVIADWMMDPVDGISMTRQIRTHSASPNQFVPVIMMTGFSEKRRVFQARDSGITEFLVKPFNVRDLYRRLSLIIERPRQFVRSEDFFGPDRRRKKNEYFKGPFKRHDDLENNKFIVES